MTMGDRIKERRKAVGLTQEEFGKKLGVQKSAVAKWENGRVTNLKRSVIQKMSQILDCAPSYLMGFEDEDVVQKLKELAKEKTDDDMILELFHQLNDEGKAQAKIQLRVLTMMDDFKMQNSSG